MFNTLVTYHIHKHDSLPANEALAYQYILAGNSLFVRAETRFFAALLPITAGTVRGLPPLQTRFQLLVPRIPARLLDAVLADAQRAVAGWEPERGAVPVSPPQPCCAGAETGAENDTHKRGHQRGHKRDNGRCQQHSLPRHRYPALRLHPTPKEIER